MSIVLTAEEKALLQKLRESGADDKVFITLTRLARAIIESREEKEST